MNKASGESNNKNVEMMTGSQLLYSDKFNRNHTVVERLSLFNKHIAMLTLDEIKKYKYYFYFFDNDKLFQIRYW